MSTFEDCGNAESSVDVEVASESARAKRARRAIATEQRKTQAAITKVSLRSVLGPLVALLRLVVSTGEKSASRQFVTATFEAWVRINYQAKCGKSYDGVSIDMMLAKLRAGREITQEEFLQAVDVFGRLNDVEADDSLAISFAMTFLESLATNEWGLDPRARSRRRVRFLREGNRMVSTFDVSRDDERIDRLSSIEFEPITEGTHHRINVCRNGSDIVSSILKPFENTEQGLRSALGAIVAIQPVLMHDERLSLVSYTKLEPLPVE